MLMAALRLNLPTVFVSGGPMEAGKVAGTGAIIDAVDALVAGGRREAREEELLELERVACPTCGSCAGMFTANSMNCLVEALGLALPGNGSLLATHARRETLFREAGRRIVDLTRRHYAEAAPEALERAGLLDTSVKNVLGETMAETLARWDVGRTASEEVRDFYRAAPGRRPSLRAFSQDAHYDALDLDRASGCIRDAAHAYSRDGGLAVLHGNLAREGSIVKTAGVDPTLYTFRGRARVSEREHDTAAA